ncbi:MAG: hypothetical protein ACRDSJ_21250, partial [Rubrobacteraceae bacterium]
LPDLREGNVASIGIGGEAYPSDVLSEIFGGTISPGVGVFAVDTGSPAGEVGLEDAEGETFDLITELEGTRLGENGNMQEYCNILRNRGQEEPISIQVFRLNYEDAAEDVVLEGELNTDNELEEVGVPADFIEQTASDDSGSTDVASADSGAEPGFVAVDDGTGALTMEVPAEWSDVSPGDWAQDELGGDVIGRSIFAAPSIEGLTSGAYDTPGVFFGASSALVEGFPDDTANQLLDQDFLDFSGECDYEGRSEYDDGVYVGQQDFYVNCGDTGAERRHIVALPEDGSFVALLQITVTDEASAEAATRIEETFLVDPSGL